MARFKHTASYPEADGSPPIFRYIPAWSQDPFFPSPGPSFALLIATRCRAADTIVQVQLLCFFVGRLKIWDCVPGWLFIIKFPGISRFKQGLGGLCVLTLNANVTYISGWHEEAPSVGVQGQIE